MALARILYDSSLVQSIISMQIAYLKFNTTDYTVTVTDTAGDNAATILNHINEMTDDTMARIAVCCGTAATHSAGKLTYDQAGLLDSKMATAYKGTSVRANTAQTNATTTEIILDSGASSSNDFYNFTRFSQEYYVKTAGVTAVYRYIKDYVGATTTATVNDTSTAITDTETFTVFSHAYVYLLGDVSTSENACRQAWTTLFDSGNIPLLVNIMGGSGSGFKSKPLEELTCDSIAAGTLTDASAFSSGLYDGTNYVVALTDTGGGTYTQGYNRVIASNTANVLTLASNWASTPTGTPTYRIYMAGTVLYDLYLTYVIPSILWDTGVATHNIFKSMLDRYDDISTTGLDTVQTSQDLATLDEYAAKGKAVVEALSAGLVS